MAKEMVKALVSLLDSSSSVVLAAFHYGLGAFYPSLEAGRVLFCHS
jgi:hypothetical protein